MIFNFWGKKKGDKEDKEIDKKKKDLHFKETQYNLNEKLEKNEKKIQQFEKQIKINSKKALEAKRSGNKRKALQILAEVKRIKQKVVKISSYNTLLIKQMANIDNIAIDNDMANIMKDTNEVLNDASKDQEDNLAVIEDTIALNEDMEYNQ